MHRLPDAAEVILFTFALYLEAPPEIWFAHISGDDELVDAYIDELD